MLAFFHSGPYDRKRYINEGGRTIFSLTYKHTQRACYLGYVTQAIVNNLAPLLFVRFYSEFNISLSDIAFLSVFNFVVQIVVDFLAAKYVDKIGYRIPTVAAHLFCTVGMVGMGVFPYLFGNAFAGLLIAVAINAIGGGLIEVLISPITESLPGEQKASMMSLLHSFYCWGHVGVILLSTLYFTLFGMDHWQFLPIIWALVPFFNFFFFMKVPLRTLVEEEKQLPMRKLFGMKLFWLFVVMMICAGAAEQAIAQWVSFFAEAGLQASKTVGDLLGTCMFAVLMGVARLFYGVFGNRLRLERVMALSAGLCVVSYLVAIFSPWPILSLVGCAICGFSVGIMWPGTLSLSAKYCAYGGTALFGLLALAGDVGCASGPGVIGTISDWIVSSGFTAWFTGMDLTEAGIKIGLCFAILFPAGMLVAALRLRRRQKKTVVEAAPQE